MTRRPGLPTNSWQEANCASQILMYRSGASPSSLFSGQRNFSCDCHVKTPAWSHFSLTIFRTISRPCTSTVMSVLTLVRCSLVISPSTICA